ncbi:helix-turn-helix domain-containing protein [Bacillus thuringiensis]
MLIKKAYQLRGCPYQEQPALLEKTSGCIRSCINHALAMRNNTYKEAGKG